MARKRKDTVNDIADNLTIKKCSKNSPYSENAVIICTDTGEVCFGKEYLNTRHWKQMRKDIYCYRNGNCQKCHRHLMFQMSRVHHLNYDNMGNETKDDLMLLCDDCHAEIHGVESRKQKRKRSMIIHEMQIAKDRGELPPKLAEEYEDLDLIDNPEKWFEKKTVTVKATEKQIAFAKQISERVGVDLPKIDTKEAYKEFISENIDSYNHLKEIGYTIENVPRL